jgi:hypothetical protein
MFDGLDRFALKGVTYYQQTRKCNKANCRTCAYGPGHGPYWFSRDGNGNVNYLGKTLPPEVTTVRTNHAYHLDAMVKLRWELLEQSEVLARHIRNEALTIRDQEMIRSLGFGDTLLPADAGAGDTDEQRQLSLV